MTKSVKAVKPKMMMTDKQAERLGSLVELLGVDIRFDAYCIERGSKRERDFYRSMISVADALYKAAGAK